MTAQGAGEEPVEVVAADGTVERLATRREMRAGRLRHRSVYVAVLDGGDPRRLLIHRRADDKDVWPGRWDLAAGGVVRPGEAWPDAARREVAEELGVAVAGDALVDLGPGAYTDADVDVVAHVYALEHPGPFRFADGEVVEACWVDPAELARRLGRDPFVPDSVQLVLPRISF